MLKYISLKSLLSLIVFTPCLIVPSQANIGMLTSWFSSSKEKDQQPNPCEDPTFLAQNGRYCSGLFNKEIRCLSDGKNPGVCDSAAVCNTKNQIAKELCENHCLNTSPQKLGNQYIQISCTPRFQTDVLIEATPEGAQVETPETAPLGTPDVQYQWQREAPSPQEPSSDRKHFHDPMAEEIQEVEIQSIGSNDYRNTQPRLFFTGAQGSSQGTTNADESEVIATYPIEENDPKELASKSHEEAKKKEKLYKEQLFQSFHWHTPD